MGGLFHWGCPMSTVIDRLRGVVDGLGRKAPVRVATTGNIALAGLQTIDGIALAENDRVLIRANTNAVQNGIYSASSGPWLRAIDFDGPRDSVQGTSIVVAQGTVYAGSSFILTTPNPVIGTSALVFSLAEEVTPAAVNDGLAGKLDKINPTAAGQFYLQQDGIADIIAEDVGAPSTSFRQKRIRSTRLANGGNSILIEQRRPNDGAVLSYTLGDASRQGDIVHTGNLRDVYRVYGHADKVVDCRAFGAGDGASGSNWTTQVQAALDSADHGDTILLPDVPWACDGLILPRKQHLKIRGRGGIAWSGTYLPPAARTNPVTGIVYDAALITQYGDSHYLEFDVPYLDGWNRGVHGINQSCGRGSHYRLHVIRCCADAIHQDIHETNAADCWFDLGWTEFNTNHHTQASDTLYAADPAKYQYINPTHMCEDTRVTMSFATAYQNFGLARNARVIRTRPNFPVAGQTTHYLSGTLSFSEYKCAFDATVYYNMDGGTLEGIVADPPNVAPNLYSQRYNGPTPIKDYPPEIAPPPYWPGFTRPANAFVKSPTKAGARDISDQFSGTYTIPVGDWFNGSQVTGSPLVLTWGSSSDVSPSWHGNTVDFLYAQSPGFRSGVFRSIYQLRENFGDLRFNGNGPGAITRFSDSKYALFIAGGAGLGPTTGVTSNFGAFAGDTATTAQLAARLKALEDILVAQGLAYRA